MIATDSLPDLYEADETAWLDAMAELISEGQTSNLDYEHLAEFLEDMTKRDRREVKSRLRILIAHLLKWVYQEDMRTPSWRETVNDQRRHLEEELLSRGTLRNHAQAILATTYALAVKDAAEDTKLTATTIPAVCPWTLEQLMSPEVLGDAL